MRQQPSLHSANLTTNRQDVVVAVDGQTGILIESYEWASREDAASAHSHPEVREIYGTRIKACAADPNDLIAVLLGT